MTVSTLLTAEPIAADAELAGFIASARGAGAVVSFTGIARPQDHHGGHVQQLLLEHYPGMTERQLRAVADEAEARWPLQGIVVVHRYGRLVPGDRIVLVAVASPHRAAAFEACAFLMDWLKTQAPFWKREETADGSRWVEARPDDDAAAARWSAKPPS